MKKDYVTPTMVCEEFAANEYVAACGDSGTVYKFKCNAGSRWSEYHVYLNGTDGFAGTEDDIDWSARSGRLKSYTPCGEAHEADTNSDFPSGYMYKLNRNGDNTGDRIPVIVWTENGTNTHCTADLKMDEWEITKS